MKLRTKIAIALLTAAAGFASSVSATSAACIECDAKFWRCGGYQDDYCTMRYEICLRQNNCPVN